MKSRFIHLLGTVCLPAILIASATASAYAQNPPSLNEPMVYAGELPTTVPGQDFDLYFIDRAGNRTSRVYESDMPVTLVISTSGLANERAWCVVYYPPDKQIRNWLLQGNYVANTGTFSLTSYIMKQGEPYGEYAFRVGLLSRHPYGGTMYWREKTAILAVEKTPPLPPDIRSFTISAASVPQGTSATLSWYVDGATRITIAPNVYDGMETIGIREVAPYTTTTYTLTATNAAGEQRSTSMTLAVELPPPPDDRWMLWGLAALIVVAIVVLVLVLIFTRRKAVPAPAPMAVAASTGGTEVVGGTQVGAVPTVFGQPGPGNIGTVIAGAVLVLPDSTEIPLTTGTTWIGRKNFERALSQDQAQYLSRQHFVITYENGSYYLEDRNSGNGTWLNGNDIRGKGKQQLRNGDQIDVARQASVTVRAL